MAYSAAVIRGNTGETITYAWDVDKSYYYRAVYGSDRVKYEKIAHL
jgi:hypothetical protein